MSPGAGVPAILCAATLGVAACTSFDPTPYLVRPPEHAGSPLEGPGAASGEPLDYCSLCALIGSHPVEYGALDEASGIAASWAHQGAFYVNNDSGDLPRFFTVESSGQAEGIFSMPVPAVDYEDIAVGPCPAGRCVFIADTGDNDAVRESYALYRVPEPPELGSLDVVAEALPFVYPDGPHNAETLLVHPITGEIVIVTKVKSGVSQLWKAPVPWAPGELATLAPAGTLVPPTGSAKITGGSVHPAGHGVLVRTYSHLFYYAASAPVAPLAETLSHVPCALPVADEPQGEAVSWTGGGDGYLTISEGSPTLLQEASCDAP